MKIEVKNVKEAKFASEETMCFEAMVYVDGKKVGRVSNQGHGGPNYYDGEFSELEKFAKEQDPDGYDPLDGVIDELVFTFLENKDLKRWCKTMLVFTMKGDEEGVWHNIKVPGGVKAEHAQNYRDQMKKRYGTKLVELINNRFWN